MRISLSLKRDEKGRYYYQLPRLFFSENIKHPYADYHPRPTYGSLSIDMTEADSFRKKLEDETGVHISFTSLIIKAAADSLEDFPILCGVWEGTDRIICPDPGEIGIVGPIQIGEEGGFFLIEKANKKTLLEISKELEAQVAKVKSEKRMGYPWPREKGEFKPLFEITNAGAIGDIESFFTVPRPIALSLLLVSSIKEKPIAKDGEIVIREMMNVTLSIDHYAMLAKIPMDFLTQLKRNLEEPDTYLV